MFPGPAADISGARRGVLPTARIGDILQAQMLALGRPRATKNVPHPADQRLEAGKPLSLSQREGRDVSADGTTSAALSSQPKYTRAEDDLLNALGIGLLVALEQRARVPPPARVGDVFQAEVLTLAGPRASERVPHAAL